MTLSYLIHVGMGYFWKITTYIQSKEKILSLENFDKRTIKKLIKEVLQEEPSLLKSLINEVLIENDLIPLPDSEPRTKRFEMNLEDDLDSFGDVFKAIA
ncbi:MAG: hypothetical protein ACI8YQ_000897 [Polaribacter sp.]|jgi:hypothetical protein